MGRFVRGSVVADLEGDDTVVCPIVSSRSDRYSVRVTSKDVSGGRLRKDSYIRPNILNTLDSSLILYEMGKLTPEKMAELMFKLREILDL